MPNKRVESLAGELVEELRRDRQDRKMVRDHFLKVRLTAVERAMLDREAWACGLTMADYVRVKLFGGG